MRLNNLMGKLSCLAQTHNRLWFYLLKMCIGAFRGSLEPAPLASAAAFFHHTPHDLGILVMSEN